MIFFKKKKKIREKKADHKKPPPPPNLVSQKVGALLKEVQSEQHLVEYELKGSSFQNCDHQIYPPFGCIVPVAFWPLYGMIG